MNDEKTTTTITPQTSASQVDRLVMGCKCKVYQSVDVQDENDMVDCGEPETIPGVCYDHCILCTECRTEPANPELKICDKCNNRLIQEADYIQVP